MKCLYIVIIADVPIARTVARLTKGGYTITYFVKRRLSGCAFYCKLIRTLLMPMNVSQQIMAAFYVKMTVLQSHLGHGPAFLQSKLNQTSKLKNTSL